MKRIRGIIKMKIRDLLYTYKGKLDKLNKDAKDYHDKHYCGYMGEWIGGTEQEYKALRQKVEDYLDSEVEI
jgi:hypothetical protein